VRFAWPLTGRSEEMRTIDAAISASDAAGIVVCGAAGVGKSRVAREALSNCASRGYESRWAIGTSSARALPLGAFASWAPATGTDNLRVVRDVIDSLTSAPLETPVVVGVDDVHLIDDLSAFVLQQIVQRRAAKVVLTIRDGEPIPAGVREIWSDGQLDRLDLQPLSRDETMTLVSATLGGPLDPDARTRLWRLTRGNVLYLRNIVEQEVGDGRLTRLHGFWRWTGEPVVSSTLAELIESRIGALPSEVGDVIDTLAVGEPIDLAACGESPIPLPSKPPTCAASSPWTAWTAMWKCALHTRSTARFAADARRPPGSDGCVGWWLLSLRPVTTAMTCESWSGARR
jgi:hypothetical protein